MKEHSEEDKWDSSEVQSLDANTSDACSPKNKALSSVQKELEFNIKQFSNDTNLLKESDDGEWFVFPEQFDDLVEGGLGKITSYFSNKQEEAVPLEEPTEEFNYNSDDFDAILNSSDDSASKGSFEEDPTHRFPEGNNERFQFYSQKDENPEEKQTLKDIHNDLSILSKQNSSKTMKVAQLKLANSRISAWFECGQETLSEFGYFLQKVQANTGLRRKYSEKIKKQLTEQFSELEGMGLCGALKIHLNKDSIFITRQGNFKFSLKPCASKKSRLTIEDDEIVPLHLPYYHNENVEKMNKFVDDFFLSITPDVIGYKTESKNITEQDMQKVKEKFNIHLLDQRYSKLKGRQRLCGFKRLHQFCTGLELADWLRQKLQTEKEEDRQPIYFWIQKILKAIGEHDEAEKLKSGSTSACSSPLFTTKKLGSENVEEETKENMVRRCSAPVEGGSQLGFCSMNQSKEDEDDFFFVVEEDYEPNSNRHSDGNPLRKYSC